MSALPVPSARLTNNYDGSWELYVVTDGKSADWPEHFFRRVVPMPTLDERAQVLATLGFELAADAEWEWQELRNGPMDRVELLASADVHPVGGAQ